MNLMNSFLNEKNLTEGPCLSYINAYASIIENTLGFRGWTEISLGMALRSNVGDFGVILKSLIGEIVACRNDAVRVTQLC